MKLALISSLFLAVLIGQKDCNQSRQSPTCFKGRLEIKGMCHNYTIKLVSGNMDTSLLVAKWSDENTGKQYSNVFGLDSPCSFPDDLKEGDEFYFTLNPKQDKNCNVCLAYYPTPPRRLSIQVSKTPCP